MKQKHYISPYWICQLIGWSVAALYWWIQGWMAPGFRWDIGGLHFISDLIMYIVITHLYHLFARSHRWGDLGLKKLLWRIMIAVVVMGIAYTIVTSLKLYLIRMLYSGPLSISLHEFISINGEAIFIAGIRLMAIWLLAYHMYHYARHQARLEEENNRLQLTFKQAQIDNLSAQLNPHFLFNALNTIKSLVFQHPAQAGRGIDLLSELLRSSLYKGDSMATTLDQEINLVRDYLELEQLRMEERLSYQLNLDPALSGQMIPRLSIQTLVENAVKHGLSLLKDGGILEVRVSQDKGFLKILVINSGKLPGKQEEQGIGLRNLEERLEINYSGRAAFRLYEREDMVHAEIQVPLI